MPTYLQLEQAHPHGLSKGCVKFFFNLKLLYFLFFKIQVRMSSMSLDFEEQVVLWSKAWGRQRKQRVAIAKSMV